MQFRPQRIVYVSCDPATQARDLKEFVEAGYDITLIQPFDLFPHTRHIENVVSLTLSARPPVVAAPEAEQELAGEIEN
jgi:23S rRNA (uracil1939-C5)-methyltransferase/tRNA (uracil-5-)-methyltransferase